MALEGAIEQEAGGRTASTPWWERNLPWLLVAPTILLFIVFAAIPALTTISYAFSRVKMARGGVQQQFVGFENFARAFQDPLVAQSAWTTIKWMVLVTAIEIALGLALALLLSGGIRGRGAFSSLLIVPIIMPPVAVSVAWFFMYDYEFGVFNYLLNQIGLPSVRWLFDPAIALLRKMAVDVWQATPFAFLLLYAALLFLPQNPYEGASIDGPGRWLVFRNGNLPPAAPGASWGGPRSN